VKWTLPLTLAVLILGCVDGGVETAGPELDVRLAALNLQGVGEVIWDLEVDNGDGDVVWQRRVTSSGYGDGAGSASYVGSCDADPDVDENTVKVWVVGVYESAVASGDAGVFASGDDSGVSGTPVDFENPTATATPLTQTVTCRDDADVAVRFDVALMRPAQQGFFDIAVNFDDIYCSAKLDCCADDGDGACTSDEEIHLLFESGGQRGRTFVLGLACTAGVADGVRTALYLDPIALDCDVNSDAATFLADVTINPAPTASPGNLCEAGALSGCAAITETGGADADTWLFQVATYQGVEELQSGGVDAQKIYWNVALGVKPAISACTLRTVATADDVADTDDVVDGGVIAAGAVYPYLRWDVPLDATCASEALTFGDDSAAVTALYTGTGDGPTSFDHAYAPSAPPAGPTGSDLESTAGEYSFVVPEGVTALTAKLWGGGGGGGGAYHVGTIQAPNGNGGAGGYAECPLTVTPGETLTLRVGGGGQLFPLSGGVSTAGGYNGGANGAQVHGYDWGSSGPGGGATEILRGGTRLCVAGGGGGGGYSYPPEVLAQATYGTYGRGGGGGQDGEKGRGNSSAEDTPGGAAGGEATMAGSVGTALGSNAYSGGSGGGGYTGGTGGTAGIGTNGGIGCGGGGGSSYAPGGTIINGDYDTVPNTADEDYVGGAATGGIAGGGGAATSPTSGGDGLVVLRW